MNVLTRTSLRQLQAFIAVAQASSFTRAARLLNLSQPALTAQIRQLEDVIGLRLLDRNKRSVTLTRAGAELVPELDRLLRELSGLIDDTSALATRKRGYASVAVLPTIAATLLPRALAAFRESHPGIRVQLRDAIAQQVIAAVKDGGADFGIGTMKRTDPELRFSPLMSDDLSVVCPSSHLLARRRGPITLQLLAQQQLLLMSPDTSVRALVDDAFSSIGRVIQPLCEASYISTTIAMIKAGQGVAILPSSVMLTEGIKGLAARPIAYTGFKRTIGVIQRTGKGLSPAAETLLEVIKRSV